MTILRHVTVIIASTGLVVHYSCYLHVLHVRQRMALPGLVLGLLRITLNFVILLVITFVRWYVLDLFCTCQNNGRTYCCFYCCGVLVTLSLLNSLLSVSTPLPPPVAGDDEYHPPPPRPRPSLQPQAPSRPQRPSSHSGHSPRPTYVNTSFIIS